ncbi:hypothetical protein CROQUDRAFT_94557 [Cronartium quercuum f. sp. fusiforme G11]|uniref:Uncharacterized protein n=1 Tax=Cronartium quercuum f. sp. fusiforme G11 TaxID=708437 RepID=A0A9P6NF38_9BASI|nr:hypothetical protein CROQUDRAFT_94557 [Cronartium quercuum f. sp. fusiforme G11]
MRPDNETRKSREEEGKSVFYRHEFDQLGIKLLSSSTQSSTIFFFVPEIRFMTRICTAPAPYQKFMQAESRTPLGISLKIPPAPNTSCPEWTRPRGHNTLYGLVEQVGLCSSPFDSLNWTRHPRADWTRRGRAAEHSHGDGLNRSLRERQTLKAAEFEMPRDRLDQLTSNSRGLDGDIALDHSSIHSWPLSSSSKPT